MKKPKISVLLTSYNHAQFIREAIDSVLAQTLADFELIIADDCSTDDSWDIIKSYSDPRIRAIRSPKNSRTAFVFEVIQSCQGQYFALIHSDDIWVPKKLEKQVRFLESNPGYVAVFTHVAGIDENSNRLLNNNAFNQKNKNRYEWLRYFFFYGNGLCHPSVLMSTDYAKQLYTQYGPTLVNDYRGWVRTCIRHEIYVLPTPLVYFRWYSNSDSGDNILTHTQLEVEFSKIIECFCTIKKLETWLAIFPELQKFVVDGECVPLYAFAQLCLEQTDRPYVVYAGLQLLFSLLEVAETRQELERLYEFTPIQLREQIRKFDIFARATRNVNYQAELKLSLVSELGEHLPLDVLSLDYKSLGAYSITFSLLSKKNKREALSSVHGVYCPSADLPVNHKLLSVKADTGEAIIECQYEALNLKGNNNNGFYDFNTSSESLYRIWGIPENTQYLTFAGYITGKPYCNQFGREHVTNQHDEKISLLKRQTELEQQLLELTSLGKRWRSENKQLCIMKKALENENMVLLERQKELEQKLLQLGRRKQGSSNDKSIIIVSHDARLGGASLVALRLGRYFKEHYGYSVHFIIYQGGPKLQEFQQIGTTHLLNLPYDYKFNSVRHVDRVINSLANAGITRVVANTVISGSLTRIFKQYGMSVISLVHEMPNLIEQMDLMKHAEDLAEHSDAVIFGGQHVGKNFPYASRLRAERVTFMGQGICLYSPPAKLVEVRRKLREHLGIPESAKIFLGCGQAEPRKGVDLMAEVLIRIISDMPDAYFVWLGNVARPDYMEQIHEKINQCGLGNKWIVLDTFVNDLAPYFYGADMFLLCSREDPFPTVALEAMATGLPVAAFKGTGGAEEMLAEGRGILAEHLDVEDMVSKILQFFVQPDVSTSVQAKKYASDFTYERYAAHLLNIFRKIPM